jgi:hypothetical protein
VDGSRIGDDSKSGQRVGRSRLQLVYSAPTRLRLPPINFQGEDARQWIEEVADHFLHDRIGRDKKRQARYLALAVDNGNGPARLDRLRRLRDA